MTITKYFETVRQVENYLQKLYGMYDYVRITGFPSFSQSGTYTFEVN
jgi:hypothetical protein